MLRPVDDGCDATLDLLEAYVDAADDDGSLTAEEARRVERHLARCASCRGELALARRLRGELRALPQLACPPRLSEAVLRRSRVGFGRWWRDRVAGPALRRPARSLWRPVAAAVGVALVVLGGAWLLAPFARREAPAPTYSQAELRRAEQEARLAFAYVGAASRRAGLDLRDGVLAPYLVAPVARAAASPLRRELRRPLGEPPPLGERRDRGTEEP